MAGKGTVGQLLVEMRADLGKLRVDVKEMENVFKDSFSNIASAAKGLAGLLGVSFSAGAIIAYSKHIVALGGQLKDLSQQTGLSGQTLSGLKSTLEENGTSLDAFAKGIFTLQKNLGGIKNDSDPAAAAVKALGLNLKELREADTETFLQLVTDALGGVTNPINRAALGAQLLGKSFRELGPAILEMAGRLAELKAGGISDEDIATLDKWGDSWTKISNNVEVFLAGQMSRLIEDLDHIGVQLQKGYLYWKKFWAGAFHEGFINVPDINAQLAELEGPQAHTPVPDKPAKFTPPVDTAAIEKARRVLEDLKTSLAELQVEQNALAQGAGAKDAAEHFKLLADTANKLDTTIEKLGPNFRKYIDAINQAKDAINNYKIAQEAAKNIQENADEKTKAITSSTEDFAKVQEELASTALTPTGQQIAAIVKRYNEWLTVIAQEKALHPDKDITAIKNEAEALKDKLIQLVDTTGQWGKLTRDAAISAIPSTEEYRKQVAQLTAQFIDLGVTIQRVGKEENKTPEQIAAAMAFINKAMINQIADVQTSGDKLGEEIANSITSGMSNTLMGIETGQQTIGAGMKNLLRNMMLELQGAVFDKTILEPLKAIASGFISGLVGALDDAANKELKKWAKGLGQQVSSWLGSGLQAILGSFGGAGVATAGGGAMSALDMELGFVPTRERGGMLPSFAGGGLFIGHGGEFVMQKKAVDNIGAGNLAMMNKTGQMPGGGSIVNVEINGDITPRQPNMTPDQVVKVTAGNITNDGMVMSAIEQRLRLRGK